MSQADEFDEYGNWLGTCESCGTDHEGRHPDTAGAAIVCLRLRIDRIGGAWARRLDRSLDRLQDHIANRRDDALRRWWNDPR